MGQIRNAKPIDKMAFPGSTYAIINTPPTSQCEEIPYVDMFPSWPLGESVLGFSISIQDIWLPGKYALVAGSPLDDGDYLILDQEPFGSFDDVIISHIFIGGSMGAMVTIHDFAVLYLTRNQRSFARFAQANSRAYTNKGGTLYTDTPNPPMAAACSTTFNPT